MYPGAGGRAGHRTPKQASGAVRVPCSGSSAAAGWEGTRRAEKGRRRALCDSAYLASCNGSALVARRKNSPQGITGEKKKEVDHSCLVLVRPASSEPGIRIICHLLLCIPHTSLLAPRSSPLALAPPHPTHLAHIPHPTSATTHSAQRTKHDALLAIASAVIALTYIPTSQSTHPPTRRTSSDINKPPRILLVIHTYCHIPIAITTTSTIAIACSLPSRRRTATTSRGRYSHSTVRPFTTAPG